MDITYNNYERLVLIIFSSCPEHLALPNEKELIAIMYFGCIVGLVALLSAGGFDRAKGMSFDSRRIKLQQTLHVFLKQAFFLDFG